MAAVSDRKKRRQIIILVILTIILVVMAFWQYLMSPLLEEKSELESEVAANEDKLSEMNNEILLAMGYERDIETTLSSISEITADLYPVMDNEDADMMLLSELNKCGLDAMSLSVGSADSQSKSSSVSTTTTATDTGISQITAVYSATGSYAQFVKFVAAMNEKPSVIIESIQASAAETESETYTVSPAGVNTSSTVTPASEEELAMELTLCVYMYEQPIIPDTFVIVEDSETEEAGTDESGYDSYL